MKANIQTSAKMTAGSESTRSVSDTLKWTAAIILLLGGLVAFYWYQDRSLLLRVVGLLVVGGVAAFLVLRTASGKMAWGFVSEARMEIRKVVWPTRKETVQTTLIVLAIVVVTGIFLAIVDALLAFAMHTLLGGGG